MTKDQVKRKKKKILDFLNKNSREAFNAEELGTMIGVSVFSASKMLTTMVNHNDIRRKGKKGKFRYQAYKVPEAAQSESGVFVVIHHGQSSPVFNDLADACDDAKTKATEADTEYVYVARLIKSFSQVVTEEDII